MNTFSKEGLIKHWVSSLLPNDINNSIVVQELVLKTHGFLENNERHVYKLSANIWVVGNR